jgi:hypothetical protein
MFTQLLGAGAQAIPNGTFSNLMSGGGGTGGSSWNSHGFNGPSHLRSGG